MIFRALSRLFLMDGRPMWPAEILPIAIFLRCATIGLDN